MCIIIDANAVAELNAPTEHGAAVLKWLLTGKGKLVIGGKLKAELSKSAKMQSTMVTLNSGWQITQHPRHEGASSNE